MLSIWSKLPLYLKLDIRVSVLQRRKLRIREGKQLSQGHTAGKGKSQGSSSHVSLQSLRPHLPCCTLLPFHSPGVGIGELMVFFTVSRTLIAQHSPPSTAFTVCMLDGGAFKASHNHCGMQAPSPVFGSKQAFNKYELKSNPVLDGEQSCLTYMSSRASFLRTVLETLPPTPI